MCRRAMNKKPARFQKGGEELLDDGARFKYARAQDVFEEGAGTVWWPRTVPALVEMGTTWSGERTWNRWLESLEGGGH